MHFCGLQSLCLLNRVRWKKNTLKQVADPLLSAPPKYQGKFSKVWEKPNVMVNLKMSWKNSWKVAEYECEPCVSCCVTGLHLIKDWTFGFLGGMLKSQWVLSWTLTDWVVTATAGYGATLSFSSEILARQQCCHCLRVLYSAVNSCLAKRISWLERALLRSEPWKVPSLARG